MNEVVESENAQYVDIMPLSKWKRVLLSLADYFLTFIGALLLFHFALLPLGKAVTNYAGQLETSLQAQNKRDQLLYESELLFYSSETAITAGDFEDNIAYTCKEYVHALVDDTYPRRYNLFERFYHDILNESDEHYVSFMYALDERHGYFDIGVTSVSLKKQYREEFAPMFNPKDAMSSIGESDYEAFSNKIFAQGYAKVFNKLVDMDYTLNGVSYATEQGVITRVLQNGKNLLSVCAFASLVLSSALVFIVVPICNKGRRTPGMLFLRRYRVRYKDYGPLSVPEVFLSYIYAFVSSVSMVMFIPWGSTGFNELFALPALFVLSALSLLYALCSLGVLLFSVYNRTIADFFCRNLILGEEEFDLIASNRGYHP